MTRIFITSLFLVFFGINTTANAQDGWITKESSYSVNETADRLAAIIDKAPPTLFARIDHQANAKKAGLELGAATVLIIGAPKVGTPIMQQNIKAALDLPVKVLIWDDNGQTKIGYLDPIVLKERYGIEGADGSFKTMKGALNKFTDGAISK